MKILLLSNTGQVGWELEGALQPSGSIIALDYKPLMVFCVFGGALLAIGMGFEFFLLGYYIIFSKFTSYKAAGFIELSFVIFGLLVLLIALVADTLNRMRVNQDQMLYEIKKVRYGS